MCGFGYFNWGAAILTLGIMLLVFRIYVDTAGAEKKNVENVSKSLFISAIIVLVVGLIMMVISALAQAVPCF